MASLFQGVMDTAHGALDVVFGVAVTHSPAAGGGPLTRRGVFERAHAPVFEGSDEPVNATGPTLWVVLADWSPAPVQGDTMVVAGESETWRVDDAQPDGSGGTLLILSV